MGGASLISHIHQQPQTKPEGDWLNSRDEGRGALGDKAEGLCVFPTVGVNSIEDRRPLERAAAERLRRNICAQETQPVLQNGRTKMQRNAAPQEDAGTDKRRRGRRRYSN